MQHRIVIESHQVDLICHASSSSWRKLKEVGDGGFLLQLKIPILVPRARALSKLADLAARDDYSTT
jgi:hypothetical protein